MKELTIPETLEKIIPQLISITLSKPTNSAPYLKIKIKQIASQKKLFYVEQFTQTQSFQTTLKPSEIQGFLLERIGLFYKNATAETKDKKNQTVLYHFLTNKKGRTSILEKTLKVPPKETASQKPLPQGQNKQKNYLLQEGKPIPFLIELGIMNKEGKILAQKYDKFKQINRFLEFVADILPEIYPIDSKEPLKIIDFGCGKSYLTFALYYYLTKIKNIPTKMLGIDLKKDVIELCNNLATSLGFLGLTFLCGDVADYATTEKPHLVISLHACDTATDYALAFAIKNKAQGILSVPCCQHELNQTIDKKNVNPALLPFLEHGIIKEHFCALATDTLRGKILEDCGYSIQLLEFIDVGHTPKNILIRGIKKREKTNSTKEYQQLSQTLGVSLTLEKLL